MGLYEDTNPTSPFGILEKILKKEAKLKSKTMRRPNPNHRAMKIEIPLGDYYFGLQSFIIAEEFQTLLVLSP